MIITIDGPAVSGKSTVAKLLARSLHVYYVNTGLLYRALAYALLLDKQYTRDRLHNPDHQDVQDCLHPDVLVYDYNNTYASIIYKKDDITFRCKDADISEASSLVAADKFVRECMVAYQRNIAHEKSVVVEGRDTGSNVFPHADIKFYLTASIGVRAQRLINFEAHKGNELSRDDAQRLLQKRDHRDMTRLHAPLLKPEGAIEIDASSMSAIEVVELMKKHIISLKKK
jgi:cytidylate kinase